MHNHAVGRRKYYVNSLPSLPTAHYPHPRPTKQEKQIHRCTQDESKNPENEWVLTHRTHTRERVWNRNPDLSAPENKWNSPRENVGRDEPLSHAREGDRSEARPINAR